MYLLKFYVFVFIFLNPFFYLQFKMSYFSSFLIPYTMGLQIPDHRLVPVHTVRKPTGVVGKWAKACAALHHSPHHSHHQLNHTYLYFVPWKSVFHGQVVNVFHGKMKQVPVPKMLGTCLLSYHIALCEPTQNSVLCSVMGSGRKSISKYGLCGLLLIAKSCTINMFCQMI